MVCPKCQAEMEKITHAGIEVDRCTGCQGIWFDVLEEDKLSRIEGAEAIDSGDPTTGAEFDKIDRIDCPKCASPLIRMVDAAQPHIRFESCKNCGGIFLDAGEFTDLQEHTLIEQIRDWFVTERD